MEDETTRLTKPSLKRPTAPRVATFTKPTSSSAARAAQTPGTLNKPPSRPTSATIPHHKKQLSVNSADTKASGDEGSIGISAKPKRISLAPSLSTGRIRLSRSSTVSPTRKPPITPTSRILNSTTRTSRPLLPTSLSSTDTRKRLSTIPASPAVNIRDKENAPPEGSRTAELQLKVVKLEAELEESMRLADDRSHELVDLRNRFEEIHSNAINASEVAASQYAEDVGGLKTELEQIRSESSTNATLAASREGAILDLQAELHQATRQHAEELENLKSESSATSTQAASQRDEVLDLLSQIDLLRSASEQSSTRYAEQIEQLRSESSSLAASKNEELERLRTEYSSTAQDNAAIVKALQDEIIRLQHSRADDLAATREPLESNLTRHENTIRKLEMQLGSTVGALQAATYKSDTLKQILQSFEEEGREKDKEHALAIEKLESDLSRAVKQLSDGSGKLMQLQMHFDGDLQRLRDGHAAELENMRSVEDARSSNIDVLEQQLAKYERDILDKERLAKAKTAELAQLEERCKDYEMQLQIYCDEKDAASKTIANLERLCADSEPTGRMSRADEDASVEKLTELRAECDGYEARIVNINDEARISQARVVELEKRCKVQEDHITAYKDEVKIMEIKLQDVEKRCDDLEAEIQYAKAAGSASSRKVMELEAACSDPEAPVADMKTVRQAEQERVKSLDNLNQDHAQQLKACKDGEANMKAKAQELEAKCVDYGRQLAASTDLEKARDAKIQALEKECADHERQLSELSSIESTSNAKIQELETAYAHLQAKCEEYESQLESTKSIGFNGEVDVQIAGIQEQLKQLDEINQEFLEEHEAMARTLSKGRSSQENGA